MQFDGAWLGVFGLGELTLDAYADDGGYQISTAIRSGGLAALFDRTQLAGTARGGLSGQSPAWGVYDLDHVYAAKRRVTQMRANAAGGVDTLVTPNYRTLGNPAASQSEKDAARDPLTSVLAMGLAVGAQRRCTGAFPVFDGKYNYTLTLSDAGFVRRHLEGGYDGPAVRCRMRLTPVSGYDADELREARGWPAAEIWFGLMDGARFAPPVHARIPFAIGDVQLRLRAFRRPEVDVPTDLAAEPRQP